MAVAVKNRETTSASVFDRLPVAIVAGVVHVLVGLAVLFPGANFVWWEVVGRSLNFTRYDTVWWLPLVGIDVALAAGLIVAGKRFLDAHPIKGLRAGIALGVAGVFLIALLTVWVGGQLADALFRGPQTILGLDARVFGGAMTAAFGIAVLVLTGRYFLSEKGEKTLAALEEQGWFSGAAYKRAQGLRVRRGTILGALVLAFCGIWVLHQGLMKQGGEAAWQVGVPFTGEVVIGWDNVGDNPVLRDGGDFKGQHIEGLAKRQEQRSEAWRERRQQALATLRQIGRLPTDVRDRLRDFAKQDPEVASLLAPRPPGAEEAPLSPQEEKQAADAVTVLREPEPGAVLPVDRFLLRDLNKWFQDSYVKITDPGSDPYDTIEPKTGKDFKPGAVVPLRDPPRPDQVIDYREGDLLLPFERQKQLREEKHDKLVQEKDRRTDPELVVAPKEDQVTPAGTEPVQYRELVLLPHVAYTLPVILAALALWLAWRCVNVPGFADFLIATEAELNKVSWTTRRRLWQDTVVVLVTVFLLAFFLLVADVLWSKVLTGIGVLQPPPPPTEKMQDQPW
jgi:preprotein translocase SecE subunit